MSFPQSYPDAALLGQAHVEDEVTFQPRDLMRPESRLAQRDKQAQPTQSSGWAELAPGPDFFDLSISQPLNIARPRT